MFFFATAYGMQAVTDGTSNTIAFAEGLVGNNQYSRTPYSSGVNLSGGAGYYDVWQSITTIPAISAGSRDGRDPQPMQLGFAVAANGFARPTRGKPGRGAPGPCRCSTRSCRPTPRSFTWGRAGSAALRATWFRRTIPTSRLPIATTPVAPTCASRWRRHGHFIKELDLVPNVVVAGHSRQWRGDQLRFVLIPTASGPLFAAASLVGGPFLRTPRQPRCDEAS